MLHAYAQQATLHATYLIWANYLRKSIVKGKLSLQLPFQEFVMFQKFSVYYSIYTT